MEFTRNNFGYQQPALTMQDMLRAIEHHKPVTRQYIKPKQQEQLLGHFYNTNVELPMNDQNKFDMNIFGLFADSDFTNLWRVNQVIKPTVYIGVTGAGKTYQIFRHATTGFVCYTTSADQSVDKYFASLKNELNQLADMKDYDIRCVITENIIRFWIIVKLVCLYSLLCKHPNYSPQQFALSQLSDATEYYADCLLSCLQIKASTNSRDLIILHEQVITAIRNKTTHYIGIAFDEAQIMLDQYYVGYFLKRDITYKDRQTNDIYRGLFYGISNICTSVEDYFDYIAYAGTQLALGLAETIQSKTGRLEADSLRRFIDFPYYKGKEQITSVLERFIDMSDCVMSEDAVRKLTGRPRTLCHAVEILRDKKETQSKQQLLDEAINTSYDHMYDEILTASADHLKCHMHKRNIVLLLSKIMIARSLKHKFALKTTKMFDFVHAGIFHLKADKKANRFLLVPTEPLGLAVVEGLVTKFKSLLPSDVDNTVMNKESELISSNEVSDMYDDVQFYDSTNENIMKRKFGSADLTEDDELEAKQICVWSELVDKKSYTIEPMEIFMMALVARDISKQQYILLVDNIIMKQSMHVALLLSNWYQENEQVDKVQLQEAVNIIQILQSSK